MRRTVEPGAGVSYGHEYVTDRSTTLALVPLGYVRNEYLPIAIEDARWLQEISQRRDPALPDSKPESIGRLSRFLKRLQHVVHRD